MSEPKRGRWVSELYFFQVLANVAALGVIIVLLISSIATVTRTATAQEKANRAVITEIQRDLTIHAKASAIRSCAVAREIRYVVLTLSPRRQPLRVRRRLATFVGLACHVEVLISPDGTTHGTTSPTTPPPRPSPTSTTPSTTPPTTIPPTPTTIPPSPHPSPSPSPTVVCVPVIGCI